MGHRRRECGSVRGLVHSLLLLLALARPAEVLEEWTLLDTAPLNEVLTARVVYSRDQGPEIVLPAVFNGDERAPLVELVGRVRPLEVTRVQSEWRARLPADVAVARPRVVVRSVRRVRDVRLFQLGWPAARGEAIRRVAIVPRGWMQSMTEGWTCADDSIQSIACVSIDTAPNPLRLRASPWPSSRASLAAAAAFALSVLGVLLGFSQPKQRLARGAAFGAAALGAAAVALAFVGARLISWAPSLALASLAAVALAALVGDDANARRAAALSLLALSLLAVFDGRPWLCAAALCASALAVGFARWLSARRRDEPSTGR
jgi:hypothetical protein